MRVCAHVRVCAYVCVCVQLHLMMLPIGLSSRGVVVVGHVPDFGGNASVHPIKILSFFYLTIKDYEINLLLRI